MSPSLDRAELLAVVTEVDVPDTHVSPHLLGLVAPKTAGTRKVLLRSPGSQFVEIVEISKPAIPVVTGDTHRDGKYTCGRGVGKIVRAWARLNVDHG